MKRKPVYILCIFAAIAVLIYMTGESYYSGITKKAGLEKKEEKVYQYQYDLIVDSPDYQFWQAVYASARKTAAQNDVLLEIMGPDRGTSYDKLDYINRAKAKARPTRHKAERPQFLRRRKNIVGNITQSTITAHTSGHSHE